MSAVDGDLAGADRPDRLISDGQPLWHARRSRLAMWQRCIELGRNRGNCLAGFAHRIAFADAQDHVEAGRQRRLGLGSHFGIAFVLRLAPLAMADDRQRRAGIEQHRRADAAGVRALVGLMDVLPADREAGHGPRRAFDQGRRHAQGDIDTRNAARRVGDRPDLGEVGRRSRASSSFRRPASSTRLAPSRRRPPSQRRTGGKPLRLMSAVAAPKAAQIPSKAGL